LGLQENEKIKSANKNNDFAKGAKLS